jgi:hypothetical protein
MNTQNTSWTRYNPEYPEPILNQDVQNGEELRLVEMETKIKVAQNIDALINATKKEIYD